MLWIGRKTSDVNSCLWQADIKWIRLLWQVVVNFCVYLNWSLQKVSQFTSYSSIKLSQLSRRSLRQILCGSHIKIWNLANHMKKQNKKHQNAKSIGEKLKTTGLMFFVSFFHVICKISNFNMWTAKHLMQASCTELTLSFVLLTKLETTQ